MAPRGSEALETRGNTRAGGPCRNAALRERTIRENTRNTAPDGPVPATTARDDARGSRVSIRGAAGTVGQGATAASTWNTIHRPRGKALAGRPARTHPQTRESR